MANNPSTDPCVCPETSNQSETTTSTIQWPMRDAVVVLQMTLTQMMMVTEHKSHEDGDKTGRTYIIIPIA